MFCFDDLQDLKVKTLNILTPVDLKFASWLKWQFYKCKLFFVLKNHLIRILKSIFIKNFVELYIHFTALNTFFH